jgi:hypothetical protein
MSMSAVDRLVHKHRQQMQRNNRVYGESQPDSDCLWNSMVNGRYFLKVAGRSIPVSSYFKALAKDLSQGRRYALSECYDSTRFTFFLDIDWKVWDAPRNSPWATRMERNATEGSFQYSGAFIKAVAEQAMKCLAFTTTNTQNVVCIVTTTTDSDGDFQMFKDMRRVCPFCCKPMAQIMDFEVCSKCSAEFETRDGCHYYRQNTSTSFLAERAPTTAVPYRRCQFQMGFHLRFQGLVVDISDANKLAVVMRTFLTNWQHKQHDFSDVPREFFQDSVDFCYKEGGGLRVVQTVKARKCDACKSNNPDCTLCGGRKTFINKIYKVMAVCKFDVQDQPDPDQDQDCDTESESGDSDFSEDSSDQAGQPQTSPSTAKEKKRHHARHPEAYVRKESWKVVWTDPGRRVLHPSTAKDIYNVLRLTSIRCSPENAVQPMFDPTQPVPIDDVIDVARVKNKRKRQSILRDVDTLETVYGPHKRKGGVVTTQQNLDLAALLNEDGFKGRLTDVPANLHDIVLRCVHDFDIETYGELHLSRAPQYTNRHKSRILVTVAGENDHFCQNIQDSHDGNHIYFIIWKESGCIRQRCHNKQRCKGWQSDAKPVRSEYLQVLFGSNCAPEIRIRSRSANINKLRKAFPFLLGTMTDDTKVSKVVAHVRQTVYQNNRLAKLAFAGAERRKVFTIDEYLNEMEYHIIREMAVYPSSRSRKAQNLHQKAKMVAVQKFGADFFEKDRAARKRFAQAVEAARAMFP